MDIIASAASIAQLLGQAISLGQQIYQAREGMRGAPKLLADQNTQLEDLLKTIRSVQNEQVLQIPEIGELLLRVHELAGELHTALEAITALQQKGPTRQFIHALGTGGQRVNHLRGILDRLDQVKTNLSMRIQLVHVAVSATTREAIQRIDENVRSVFCPKSPVDDQQYFSKYSQNSEDTLLDGNDTLTSDPNKENDFFIDKNSASDGSDQFNAICGMERLQKTVKGVIYDNVATGKSKQRNVIMDAESFERLWARWEE